MPFFWRGLWCTLLLFWYGLRPFSAIEPLGVDYRVSVRATVTVVDFPDVAALRELCQVLADRIHAQRELARHLAE